MPVVDRDVPKLTKVSPEDLKAFGTAVKRARALRGWTLDELGAKFSPAVGKSFISKVEKGRKEALGARTVGRFINVLELEESWIDRFLGAEETEDSGETQIERDADRLIKAVTLDPDIPQGSEDLLILLANQHAKGDYSDRITAFVGLREALLAAERIRARGEMPPGNADAQFHAILREVAALNAEGELDAADAVLEAEERRMFQAFKAEQDRMDQRAQAMLERRLDQDRLRDDPAAAADRLIKDLLRQAPAGGVFGATDDLLNEWRERGERQGDPFDLRVALLLANRNYKRAKGTQRFAALSSLGLCRWAIGEWRRDTSMLRSAEEALRAAVKLADKQNAPLSKSNSAGVLRELGKRERDAGILREAVQLSQKACAEVSKQDDVELWNSAQMNLGFCLQALGEMEQSEARLSEAVEIYEPLLADAKHFKSRRNWADGQVGFAITLRALARLTKDASQFDRAQGCYEAALEVFDQENSAFSWANAIGGLGELALDRFALDPDPSLLDEAESRLTEAKSVMSKSSEVLDDRIDDLLIKITAARAGSLPV